MKVRMLTSIASPDFAYEDGEEVTVDNHLGAAWCEAGIAEPVAVDRREKAVLSPPQSRSAR